MDDEEREKKINESRERRERLLNGSVTVSASMAPAAAMDARFMKKKKARKTLFGSLTSAFKRKGDEVMYANMSTVGEFKPVMPSYLAAPMQARLASPALSAHTIYPSPGLVTMPVPSVAPSPSLHARDPTGRSITPSHSPRNPN